MNWSKIKSIFIILFLLSDMFMLGLLVKSHMRRTSISPEVVASTVDILKDNGVNIDAEIIPKKIGTVHYAEVENVIGDYEGFAKAILGEDAVMTADDRYENGDMSVRFSGNGFLFNNNAEINRELGTDENTARNVAAEFLTKIGFKLKRAKVVCNKNGNGCDVTYSTSIGGLPLFGSEVTVSVMGNSVATVSGTWFNEGSATGTDSVLKSITSVLIDTIPNFDTSAGEITIRGIELGYIVPESSTYHKSATLVPVWKISDTAGNAYYSDARSTESSGI